MDPQDDFEPEVLVVSMSDNVESTPLARNAKPFIKSFSYLPSLLKRRFQTSGTGGTWKHSDGRQAAEQHPINNYYNYHIAGGFGGSGGEGRDQGGEGGIGKGPIVYFGQPPAQESSEFRTIRLGDINLIKEFKEMRFSLQSSLVGRQTPGASVRRVYTAKVEGRESDHMTVAIYQGDGAEETWNQHLANYESIRHPNIMQLYGLVSSKGLYAMVFHDGADPRLGADLV
ncbi:hypothetical protein MSAN_01505100 [Mycena sanguinolenta]|uniref:Protein kinase domain-containing protein n=1 Tax=Mycena sanguinolenta TaxID=230812 RepID=A0A8H6Y309_9AGAR|nr:hypothetical protein MSAN_01505100 [Mycena sanguinolenta]